MGCKKHLGLTRSKMRRCMDGDRQEGICTVRAEIEEISDSQVLCSYLKFRSWVSCPHQRNKLTPILHCLFYLIMFSGSPAVCRSLCRVGFHRLSKLAHQSVLHLWAYKDGKKNKWKFSQPIIKLKASAGLYRLIIPNCDIHPKLCGNNRS